MSGLATGWYTPLSLSLSPSLSLSLGPGSFGLVAPASDKVVTIATDGCNGPRHPSLDKSTGKAPADSAPAKPSRPCLTTLPKIREMIYMHPRPPHTCQKKKIKFSSEETEQIEINNSERISCCSAQLHFLFFIQPQPASGISAPMPNPKPKTIPDSSLLLP